ncbi:MAG: hypothetical protein Q8R57_09225 [Bacteroidota bacterium]|nr:hypothetical protein [Bacteroidota bacterium]
MNNEPWFLIKDDNKLYIQQLEPYTELYIGLIHRRPKAKQEYFEVRLSDSVFEITIELFYFFDGVLQLFHTQKQIWKYFEDAIFFVLDSLMMGNYGVIRIAKITSVGEVEVKMQDKIVKKWIKSRID